MKHKDEQSTIECVPPQHVALLCLLQYQDKFVDAVDLVFDILDERPKRIGDVVDQGVRDPVGGDAYEVLELLDAPAHVLRVRRRSEVELYQGDRGTGNGERDSRSRNWQARPNSYDAPPGARRRRAGDRGAADG